MRGPYNSPLSSPILLCSPIPIHGGSTGGLEPLSLPFCRRSLPRTPSSRFPPICGARLARCREVALTPAELASHATESHRARPLPHASSTSQAGERAPFPAARPPGGPAASSLAPPLLRGVASRWRTCFTFLAAEGAHLLHLPDGRAGTSSTSPQGIDLLCSDAGESSQRTSSFALRSAVRLLCRASKRLRPPLRRALAPASHRQEASPSHRQTAPTPPPQGPPRRRVAKEEGNDMERGVRGRWRRYRAVAGRKKCLAKGAIWLSR